MDIWTTGILLVLAFCQSDGKASLYGDETNTDSYLNSAQIIRKYGYPAESYEVKTVDGYLLTMHRIPNGRQEKDNNSKSVRKPPIYIQHGLIGTSMDFLMISSERSLAFLMADLGFDVWLGNVRGNTYSRAHETFFPDQRQFWNFTWHESAIYDLPAQIDFIRNYTKEEKLIYMGHSMGTTMFFVLMSTIPEYNEKIEVALLMAPIAYVENLKSPLIRLVLPVAEEVLSLDDYIQGGQFPPSSRTLGLLLEMFCTKNVVKKSLCINIIFLLTGSDPEEFDKRILSVLLNNYPSTYSAMGLNHYSQLVKSGKFRQYDYGKERNMIKYGSLTPPDYNLTAITAPMYFYSGKNDLLSTPPDVKRLAKELPTLKKLYVVKNPKFTHLDFLISVDVKKLVYDVITLDLMTFLGIKPLVI